MEAYLLDWASLLLRWLHVIAGIVWIGASFYFVALDNSLDPPNPPKKGVLGEKATRGEAHARAHLLALIRASLPSGRWRVTTTPTRE